MLPRNSRKQALFYENVSSEWIRTKRIPRVYHDKKPELWFTSMSAYMQSYVKPKDQCASVIFNVPAVKYLGSAVFIVAALAELRYNLPKAQNPKLAAITKEKTGKESGKRLLLEEELSCSIADTVCLLDLRMLLKSR